MSHLVVVVVVVVIVVPLLLLSDSTRFNSIRFTPFYFLLVGVGYYFAMHWSVCCLDFFFVENCDLYFPIPSAMLVAVVVKLFVILKILLVVNDFQ